MFGTCDMVRYDAIWNKATTIRLVYMHFLNEKIEIHHDTHHVMLEKQAQSEFLDIYMWTLT